MLFDMGFDVTNSVKEQFVKDAIAEMDSFFDLVLITEKMDESLILLKESLCWDYSDIIFLNKNSRAKGFVKTLSVDHAQKLEELNKEDMMLYEHFFQKHEVAVDNYGRDKMAAEVAKLRLLRQNTMDECSIHTVRGKAAQGKFMEYSNYVDAFILDDESDSNCVLLSLPELSFIEDIREWQKNLLSNVNITSPA